MKKTLAILALSAVMAGPSHAFTAVSDSFSATELNLARWYKYAPGKADLVQHNGVLNFTVARRPAAENFASVELTESYPGYNEDWEVTVFMKNTLSTRNAACTFAITNAGDRKDRLNIEFFGKAGVGGAIYRNNVRQQFIKVKKSKLATIEPTTKGGIRVGFSKDTKLMTFSAYIKPKGSTHYKWLKIGTFSPADSGGTFNSNWQMSNAGGLFAIQLQGFTLHTEVPAGKITFDKFNLTGPSASAAPQHRLLGLPGLEL